MSKIQKKVRDSREAAEDYAHIGVENIKKSTKNEKIRYFLENESVFEKCLEKIVEKHLEIFEQKLEAAEEKYGEDALDDRDLISTLFDTSDAEVDEAGIVAEVAEVVEKVESELELKIEKILLKI